MAAILQFQTQAVPQASRLWDKATPFSNIPERKYTWVVDDLIPAGESLILAGDFGSFKSYFSYFLADAISQGTSFISRNVSQHPVLFLDRENSHATVSLRRYLVGNLKTANNVRILGRFTDAKAPDLNDAGLIETCRAVKPVVIVDSMQDFHPGLKENDADDMTKFSGWVNALIDAGAVSVILLHHVNRSGRYRGSSGIPGGVGGAILISKDGASVRLKGFKTRDGENKDIELKLKFSPGRADYEVIRSGIDRASELKTRIIEHVQHNDGCSASELVDALGSRRQDIYDLVEVLTRDGQLIRDASKKSSLHPV